MSVTSDLWNFASKGFVLEQTNKPVQSITTNVFPTDPLVATGQVSFERVGNVVTVNTDRLVVLKSNPEVILVIPEGFRPWNGSTGQTQETILGDNNTTIVPALISPRMTLKATNNGNFSVFNRINGDAVPIAEGVPITARFNLTYVTMDAFPTATSLIEKEVNDGN